MKNIEIRMANQADIHDMVSIKIERLHVGEPVHPLDDMMHDLFLREFKKRWEERLKMGVNTLLITANKQIVGFVSYSTHESSNDSEQRSAEISHFYILPAMRRMRLGSRLCLSVMDKISKSGFENVLVWVPACSRPSILFYEQLGFKVTDAERIEKIRENIELREICYQITLKK